MQPRDKYARIERERRFLLERFPSGANVTAVRRIEDRYLEQTRLRLRRQTEADGSITYKLTQKIPAKGSGAQQGLITNIYLNEKEFALLSGHPGSRIAKTRHSVPPFGIDVFEDHLAGLILAEAEFDSAEAAERWEIPAFARHEVSGDIRFTGARLAVATREELHGLLREYGITPI